jgi:hypothetical protein
MILFLIPRKITRQIELQVETIAKVNRTITLKGKVEITDTTKENNILPTENMVEDNPTITLQRKEEITDVIKVQGAKDLIIGEHSCKPRQHGKYSINTKVYH